MEKTGTWNIKLVIDFKRAVIGLLVILVIAASVGSYFFFHIRAENQLKADIQALQQSFNTQNPTNTKVLNVAAQTKTWTIAWQDDKQNQYVSAFIGGVWVKLTPPIPVTQTPAPTTTPAPTPSVTP